MELLPNLVELDANRKSSSTTNNDNAEAALYNADLIYNLIEITLGLNKSGISSKSTTGFSNFQQMRFQTKLNFKYDLNYCILL